MCNIFAIPIKKCSPFWSLPHWMFHWRTGRATNNSHFFILQNVFDLKNVRWGSDQVGDSILCCLKAHGLCWQLKLFRSPVHFLTNRLNKENMFFMGGVTSTLNNWVKVTWQRETVELEVLPFQTQTRTKTLRPRVWPQHIWPILWHMYTHNYGYTALVIKGELLQQARKN